MRSSQAPQTIPRKRRHSAPATREPDREDKGDCRLVQRQSDEELEAGLYRRCLDLTGSIACSLGRHNGLSRAEAEDFRSVATLKIISNSREILGGFRGESALRTYLGSVVRNCFRDFIIARSGKWRPSARATTLGLVAVEIERLRTRDGLSDEDAYQIVRQRWHRPVLREEVDRLLRVMSVGTRRRWVPLESAPPESVSCMPAPWARDRDARRLARRILRILGIALKDLEPRQITLLRRHYGEGTPVSGIAREIGLPRRSAYSLRDRTLRQLRRRLEAEGVSWEDARVALGCRQTELGELLG